LVSKLILEFKDHFSSLETSVQSCWTTWMRGIF